jgi:hypothetical protein
MNPETVLPEKVFAALMYAATNQNRRFATGVPPPAWVRAYHKGKPYARRDSRYFATVVRLSSTIAGVDK